MSKYIKKADYIAMYGKEAWDAYTAKKNEYDRQWRKEHPDYDKQYGKRYYEEHKEEKKEYSKQWYQDNIEERREYGRQYAKKHKEESKQYREDNKKYIAEYHKQYRSTQWGRAKSLKTKYIQTDKEKGFSTDQSIDEGWIIENIFNSSCIYCGDNDWTHLGADRIDNTKGHTADNCVCSCWDCNKERKDRYTVEEFVQLKKKEKKNEKTC